MVAINNDGPSNCADCPCVSSVKATGAGKPTTTAGLPSICQPPNLQRVTVVMVGLALSEFARLAAAVAAGRIDICAVRDVWPAPLAAGVLHLADEITAATRRNARTTAQIATAKVLTRPESRPWIPIIWLSAVGLAAVGLAAVGLLLTALRGCGS